MKYRKNKIKLKVAIGLSFIILLITITVFTSQKGIKFITLNDSKSYGAISANYSNEGLVVIASSLIPNSTSQSNANTEILQKLIDEVSAAGGGIVHIPAGTYYFGAQSKNERNYEYYVIKCKNNVIVEGSGTSETTGTVLKPYGLLDLPLDMFYYNELADKGIGTYLENADFRNFVINGEDARCQVYNTAGKGFMINLYRNCDWNNVVVKNTDGTGFGMDNPINCTVTNCTAIGCGKAATSTNAGASGFGIGQGYSTKESIYISNCTAIGNRKFGFFFEHQGRFSDLYQARTGESLVVSNCIARGNMYDFGGEKAVDVTFENCTSSALKSSDPNPLNIQNVSPIYFGTNSRRVHVINFAGNHQFSDVASGSNNYDALNWSINKAITFYSTTNTAFSPNNACTRAEAIEFLWRMAERQGEVTLKTDQDTGSGFSDVPNDASYKDAVKWAKSVGIINSTSTTNTTFSPMNTCQKAAFITMLWRYVGEPKVSTGNNFSDIVAGAYYEEAVNWALNKGIISDTGQFLPSGSYTKGEIINLLYKFDNASNTFSIKYNLQGGNATNRTSYISGREVFTLSNPSKTGYTFTGWTGSNYTTSGYMSNYTPSKTVSITSSSTGNRAYTANWSANKYTITFNSNGGSGTMATESFTYDVPQKLTPNKFTKVGYRFIGWSTSPSGNKIYNDESAVINLTSRANGNITLYAQYESDPNSTYNVTYNYTENGGTSASIVTDAKKYGETINLSATATKFGYQFIGWNTNKNATIGLSNLTMGTQNVTLYAIFKKDITLTFIDYNGDAKAQTTKDITIYNKATGTTTAPQINNYTGWNARYWTTEVTANTTTSSITSGGTITNINANTTYYARYTKTIQVEFNANGGKGEVPQSITGNIETNSSNINSINEMNVTIPSASITKEGYTFNGWNTKEDGTGIDYEIGKEALFKENVILYAKWTKTAEEQVFPELGIDYLKEENWTNQDIVLNITAIDRKSGIKSVTVNNEKIEMQNGKYTYNIRQNGTYIIKAENNQGNFKTAEVKIFNIDKTIPEISHIQEEIKEHETIIKAKDNQSGIAKIEYSYDQNTWYSITKESRDENFNVADYQYKTTELAITINWLKNAKIYFRTIDVAGNISNIELVEIIQNGNNGNTGDDNTGNENNGNQGNTGDNNTEDESNGNQGNTGDHNTGSDNNGNQGNKIDNNTNNDIINNNTNSNQTDTTISNKDIPQTGIKSQIVIICGIISLSIVAVISIIKYRKLTL